MYIWRGDPATSSTGHALPIAGIPPHPRKTSPKERWDDVAAGLFSRVGDDCGSDDDDEDDEDGEAAGMTYTGSEDILAGECLVKWCEMESRRR